MYTFSEGSLGYTPLNLKYMNIYVLRVVNLDVRNSNDSWSLIFTPRKVSFTLQMLSEALFAKLLAVKLPEFTNFSSYNLFL